MSKNITTTVIGLGSIGWGVACCLVREGFTTYGVVRRDEMGNKFNAQGGIGTQDIHNAVANSDAVFLYVINAQQVQDILFGDNGCVKSAKPDTVFVLGVTMPPETTLNIANTLERMGMQVIDAPVSGGSVRSLNGELTLMASGKADVFDKIDAPLQAISSHLFRLGENAGAGSAMKMVNQLLAGIHVASMGEAMALAHRMGLDLSTVYDVILQSAGYSWMFENRGAHVRDADYTVHSALDLLIKDLNIVKQQTTGLNFQAPLTEMALSLYKQASKDGYGQQDDASIAKWIARNNGFHLHGDDT